MTVIWLTSHSSQPRPSACTNLRFLAARRGTLNVQPAPAKEDLSASIHENLRGTSGVAHWPFTGRHAAPSSFHYRPPPKFCRAMSRSTLLVGSGFGRERTVF